MNGELLYTRHPWHQRLFWAFLYVLLVGASIFALYLIANHIRTHTLPTGQIELSVPYSKYAVGEAVTFSIKNGYNSAVYVTNNCPSEPLAVYRQENGQWIRQHDQASLSECRDEQRLVSLPANSVVNGTFAPWHNLFAQPGKYMVVAFVEYYNALPYQEFEIVAPSTSPAASPAPTTGQQTIPGVQPPAASPPSTNQTVSTSRGSLDVQYNSSVITVISVNPAAGCTYEGGRSGRQVQVTFICQSGQTQVQLNVVNGQLVPTIESGAGD